ncbi:MAG: glycine cleavage T C-terminal barrel domain-containing protein [Arenicellales bacterium]|nr:glycine cleavage T C-terminal barrel domain-containing protein [Arenicellales bacterium]MDP6917655.1 glycine cleavage T C-terminal barrel domain-containing protein [Arenicellales bacterium]
MQHFNTLHELGVVIVCGHWAQKGPRRCISDVAGLLAFQCIGVAVSGAYGCRTGKSLAFLLLPVAKAAADGPLVVEVLGRMCPARLLPKPAYDPDNRLARA